MGRKTVSGIMLSLLLVGMLILTFNIQLIKAEPSNMGELIIEVVYVTGDVIYLVYAQGRIIETGQEFQTDPWNLTSFELTVGNYTIEVTYENETKTERAEILDGQTTCLLIDFGEYIGPPPFPGEGYTLLTIRSSPDRVTFTVDGVSFATPWSGMYSEGSSVSLVMPETYDGFVWSHWLEDGDPNRTKTVTVNTNITLTAVFADQERQLLLETDKGVYERGENVTITFTNGGVETVYFLAYPPFIINGSQGYVAPNVQLLMIVEVPPRESLSWTWNQINGFLGPHELVPAGNYTLTAEVYNSNWELIAILSTSFEIVESEIEESRPDDGANSTIDLGSLLLETDKAVYAHGEWVNITFTNGGNATVELTSWPCFEIYGSQGYVAPTVLAFMIVEVPPGGSHVWAWDQIGFVNGLSNPDLVDLVPPGTYTVILLIRDPATGLWVGNLTTRFEIEPPIVPEFPSAIILPLFMIATLLAVIVYRRKHSN